MKKGLMNLAAAGLLSLAAGSLKADATTAPTPAATPAAPKWYDGVKFDGFVESYYKYNPNPAPGAGSASIDHGYDLQQNDIALGGGRIGMKSTDGFATVDLYFGDYGNALAGFASTSSYTLVQVGQAFISEAFGPVNLTLGRYMTHVGYEVIDSVNNQNFTRSLLYGAEPIYHTGAKLNYTIGSLGLMAQVDDGENANTTFKNYFAGGAQVSYSGVKGLALYLNYYYQPTAIVDSTDPASGLLWSANHFLNFVATYNVMDGLDLGGEYLYITTIYSKATDSSGAPLVPAAVFGNPKQQGYALYASYVIPGTGGLKVSPRFETWYTPDGAYQQKLDYTLTLKYARGPITNWLEYRLDASDSYDSALTGYPMTSTGTATNSEMAFTYGLTYSY